MNMTIEQITSALPNVAKLESKAGQELLALMLEQMQGLCVERDALKEQVVNLAVESSTIKTMNDCLSEELRGYESDGAFDGPDMHKLWYSHAGALPATSVMLANIQAQGVEKFGRVTIEIGVGEKDSDIIYAGQQAILFAAQLRKGAAE